MASRSHPTIRGSRATKETAEGKPYIRDGSKARTNAQGRESGRVKKIPEGKRGNITADQAWISAEEAAGRIRIIEDDSDVPFGVRMQWTGKPEDWGSEFQIPSDPHRCTGRSYVRDETGGKIIDTNGNILTRPCAKWRMRGLNVCSLHGGMTDGGKAAARRRAIEASDFAMGHLIRIIDRLDVETADRIKAIKEVLDRAGIKAGQEETVEVPEWQRMLKDMWENPYDANVAKAAEQSIAQAMGEKPKRGRKASPPKVEA